MPGIIRFLFGAIGGGMLAWLASQAYLLFSAGTIESTAISQNRSPDEVASEWAQRYGPAFLSLVVMGAMIGGATAALAGRASPEPLSKPRPPARGSTLPFDRAERQRILAMVQWADLRGKSPDYVRGLIVGRLVESDPAIAKRVDEIGSDELDALVEELQRRKSS